jgi:hypothetical protein
MLNKHKMASTWAIAHFPCAWCTLPYRHMQFDVEYGPMWYENKAKTTKWIHLLNLLGENNPKGVQKPSQKDHLPINATCVRMLIWRNQKKIWGFGLARNF